MKKIMPLIYLNFATAVALASEGTLPAKLKSYVANFNLADTETVTNAISNAAASDFLLSNVPLFECSDKDIERTYYFRWWIFRKHLRHGTGHWTVSEFLPEVGWAGPNNSIVCAAGHHFREARWLRDRSIVGDLARFWLSNPATETNRWQYSSWLFTSVRDAVKVSGDEALLRSLLSDAVRYYEQWEKGKDYRLYGRNWKTVVPFRMGLRECGMFASVDNHEGTEITLSGSGFRPLFNCAMWSEANVIASVAAETGDAALAARFKAKADALAEEIKRNLWDGAFFVTMTTNKVRTAAHELHGYAPWYFGMPLAREYDIAFRELAATDGFRAKWGLAFAAQRTPGFSLTCDWHECFWTGPVWPFATSIALTAVANRLQAEDRPTLPDVDFTALLHDYASAQVLMRADGSRIPWIDESQDPYTGDWITRTLRLRGCAERNEPYYERGKDYNHSTFCDLVIAGLAGLVPHRDGRLEVRPLFPKEWDYLAMENVPYHGSLVSIYWDRDGKRYGKGAGLSVFKDGRRTETRPVSAAGIAARESVHPPASIVNNGGFEILEGGVPSGWKLAEGYSAARGMGRNGTAAVAFSAKTTREGIRPVMQNVALDGGESYTISCWVKIDGRRGANIGLEWFDKGGKFYSTYSPNLKGPKDWTLVTLKTPKLPDDLATCNVLLCASYIEREGTVFMDDVAIEKCETKPIAGLYTSAYRGVASAHEPIVVKASLNLPRKATDKESVLVTLQYHGADGELHTAKPKNLALDAAAFELDGGDLAAGAQTLVCTVATNGVEAGRASCEIEHSDRAKAWRVRFDNFGRTLVDGKPFFPLGMYMAKASEKELAVYREAPFNCVMPYAEPTREALNRCANAGLKVIFSLKDVYRHKTWAQKKGINTERDEEDYVTRRINEFKTHPAVLAWYIDDESGPDYVGILSKRRALSEKLDPDHPTWMCLYQIHQLEAYMSAIDCIGTDPYPVARSPLSLAANWTRVTFKNTFGTRPVWMVPQAFSWKWYPGGRDCDRMPSESEMRAMSWQMIACGANGLIYYAFHNIRANSGADYERNWSAVKTVAAEIARHIDIFLAEPGSSLACNIDEAKLPVRTWRRGGKTFVLAVNATPNESAAELAADGFSSSKPLFGTPAVLSNGRLTATLPPWGISLAELH